MPRPLVAAALAAAVLVSCSSDKRASSPPTTSAFFDSTTTSTLPATPVVARVLSPEDGSVQGNGGRGMVVVLTFTASDPAMLPAEFRLGGALPAPAPPVKPGHNPAFPGLVITLSSTEAALGGPTANLANLVQIVSPSKQPDGSVQVSVAWTNHQTGFGSDVDTTLVAFTVAGTAPDSIPQASAETPAMEVTSNPAEVTFRLSAADGAAVAASTTTTTTTTRSSTTTSVRPTTTTARATATTVAPTTPSTRAATTTTAPRATTTTTKILGLF